jgi:hypothetical protein
MDAYDYRALTCVPSLSIAFFVVLCVYPIFSPRCWNTQTMMGRMDDQTDGQMDEMMFHNVLYYM